MCTWVGLNSFFFHKSFSFCSVTDGSIVGSAIWPLGDTATQEKATDQLRDERIAALRALAPETGSYMSEVSYHPSSPT